jgi:hypothetical protein
MEAYLNEKLSFKNWNKNDSDKFEMTFIYAVAYFGW